MVEGVARDGRRARADPAASRNIWWRVHQWAGLQLSLFLTFVFVTGTLAVFSSEIDWALRPAMWAAPTPASERVSWGTVGEAVQAYAGERPLMLIYAPIHPAAAFNAMIEGERNSTHVYVHPRTGEVTGEGPWAGVQRFLRNTHRHLMLPIKYGVPIVCMAAVFLTVSFVTSFWVYKKWWRGFLRWPRGRNARAWIGDLHRFMGLWSLWFVLIMIATGFWYLVEELGAGAPPLPHQVQASQQSMEREAAPLPLGAALDRGVLQIQQSLPGYVVEQVSWPSGDEPYFEVHGHTDRAILVRPRANAVRIDARTGDIVSQVDPRTLNAHQRISEAADPLHFGTLGGYPTKIVWFLFGAGLSALSITGVTIYALRLAKAERTRPGWAYGARKAWRAMGPLRWPALGLSLLGFILAPFVL